MLGCGDRRLCCLPKGLLKLRLTVQPPLCTYLRMEVIAERVLEFTEAGAEHASRILVRLGKPESDGADWRTPYEIHGPGEGQVRQRHAMGIDSMQSLFLALQVIPAELARYR